MNESTTNLKDVIVPNDDKTRATIQQLLEFLNGTFLTNGAILQNWDAVKFRPTDSPVADSLGHFVVRSIYTALVSRPKLESFDAYITAVKQLTIAQEDLETAKNSLKHQVVRLILLEFLNWVDNSKRKLTRHAWDIWFEFNFGDDEELTQICDEAVERVGVAFREFRGGGSNYPYGGDLTDLKVRLGLQARVIPEAVSLPPVDSPPPTPPLPA